MNNFLANLLLVVILCGCASKDTDFALYKKKHLSYKAEQERLPEKAVCISQDIKPIPESVVKQANDYVIEIVGKEYFIENYTLLEEKSYGRVLTSCDLAFRLLFDYQKLSTLFGRQTSVYVNLSWPNSEVYITNKIALIVDNELVEPVITKELAQEIFYRELYLNKDNAEWVSKQTPSAPSLLALSGTTYCARKSPWCWVYHVSLGGGLGCEDVVNHEVDIVSGEFTLDDTPDHNCELIVQ